MNQYKTIYIKILAITLLVFTLGSCSVMKPAVEIPTTTDGYTALRDPFGAGIKSWSLARPFGAKAGRSEGYWPAEVYITEGRQSADIYPIAMGKVVKVGDVDPQAKWRGQYVVIEHNGRFLLPASNGTHIRAARIDELPANLPSGHMDAILAAEDIFTTEEKLRHDFTGEVSYALNEDTVSRIYSVYKNLTAVNVRTGTAIRDLSEPLGRLNVVPTQADYIPALELEIRYFGSRDVNSAAYNAVMGPSGDGSFADIAQMLGFGYLEPSPVIQANLDENYYNASKFDPEPSNSSVAQVPGTSAGSGESTDSQPTDESETSEPDESITGEPATGTEEEIALVRNYLLDLNNYRWFSGISSVPLFDNIGQISSEWLAERFLWEAIQKKQSETVSLAELEALARAKINPAIDMDPDSDYSRIPMVSYDAAAKVFRPAPAGIEGWTNTNDIRLQNLTRIGDRFEALVYELSFRPIHYDTGSRNFGLVSVSDRYVGFFDHDQFDLDAGRSGLVLRYPLSSEEGRLDQVLYILERDESGRLTLLEKRLQAGSAAYRDSLPSIASIQIEQGTIANTGGLRLRIRDDSSMNAGELGYIDEGRPIYVIGPPTNGFLLVFDPAADHAPTGFASSQYIRKD